MLELYSINNTLALDRYHQKEVQDDKDTIRKLIEKKKASKTILKKRKKPIRKME